MFNEARRTAILAIARINATVGVDQNEVEGYYDNLLDTIAELHPDYTDKDVAAAIDLFDAIAGSNHSF